MTFIYSLLAFIFGFICVFMVLLILLQKGRGGGLSGAFGGGGGNTAFGAKTGDMLTWVTAVVFGIFLILSMTLIWTGDRIYARNMQVQTTDYEDDDVATAPELSAGDAPPIDLPADRQFIPPGDTRTTLPDQPIRPVPERDLPAGDVP